MCILFCCPVHIYSDLCVFCNGSCRVCCVVFAGDQQFATITTTTTVETKRVRIAGNGDRKVEKDVESGGAPDTKTGDDDGTNDDANAAAGSGKKMEAFEIESAK